MCGINGIIGIDAAKSTGLVTQMNDALAHRGPNDQGIFTYQNICLGHRRLSIIDLSAAGHQPMAYDSDRYTIIYNGELYNYLEIKTDLQKKNPALKFSTQTDTEVIIAAYAQWGIDCLQKFNGMYAFAIFDKQNNELVVARDRLGIKPLYYYKQNNTFIFSSEIRALLSSGLIQRRLNRSALADYLRYQTVHAPNTIIQDVFILMPGHYATLNVTNNHFKSHNYWDIVSNTVPLHTITYNEACRHVNTLFTKAVKRRLVADVPFGAFLSGGIDSSAVVGTMCKVAEGKVKTFSISFNEKKYNEEEFSSLIAKKFQTEHYNIKLSVNDFKTQLPDALKAMDHPGGDGPNSYVVSKATKQAGITMALSGLGGDELFAGYPIFKRTKSLLDNYWLQLMPQSARKLSGFLFKTLYPSVASYKIAEVLSSKKITLEKMYPLSRQLFFDDWVKKLVKQDAVAANVVEEIAQQITSKITADKFVFSQISLLEIQTYMQNVLLRDTDQMSMANALEVRVPFLDYELVEFVLSLRDDIKYPHTPKKLLVDAMGDLLPPEIVNRKKMGFTFPWQHWLKNDLKQFCEERIYLLAKRSLFNENEVIDLWKLFLNNDKRVPWSRIWYLVVLENWLTENKVE